MFAEMDITEVLVKALAWLRIYDYACPQVFLRS